MVLKHPIGLYSLDGAVTRFFFNRRLFPKYMVLLDITSVKGIVLHEVHAMILVAATCVSPCRLRAFFWCTRPVVAHEFRGGMTI